MFRQTSMSGLNESDLLGRPVEKIRARVSRILQENGIKEPPVPVEQIAKALGAEIRYEPFSGNLSGALLREASQAVIGVNALHAETRQRFTIVHELGHLVLHEGHLMHFDRAPFRLNLRDSVSAQATDPEEIAANRFAAELLMPVSFLKKDLAARGDSGFDVSDDGELELVSWLAERYKVSVQAMAIRLSTLGFTVSL